ncbi:MAG: acyl-CoA dehydrogenase family protein [candidate division Zixibacteria bacterium]|nr:acyl-CoA dehydrogenase family protein [candidate division Zixibacteria bacterium]MDH3937048.1 acyl-CoA dehydrogenase family protein [candidate division Zixibacteria bacterium]
MDFALNEDHLAVQEVARTFTEKKLKPKAEEFDAEQRIDRDLLKEMGELGLMGITLPEQYGGGEMDAVSYMVTSEELSRGCPSHCGVVMLHNSLYGFPLVKHGTEEQKQKYLPPVCTGEYIGAFALSEPGAGSDAASLTTTYQETDDGYVINGTKIFITMGSMCDNCLVFAIKEKGGGPKAISAFLVDRNTEGFEIGTNEKKMGFKASPTSELIFADCKVPKDALLGREGEGFKIAMSTLDGGRISVGAMAVGIAQEALELAVKYSQEREQFGKPLAAFQAIQFHLADMSVQVEAARNLVYKAAWLKDQGEPYTMAGAQAKLFASEMSTKVTHSAVQVMGGYGYCSEYHVERLYRDARVTELFEGTSEMQRIVIARQLMPRR